MDGNKILNEAEVRKSVMLQQDHDTLTSEINNLLSTTEEGRKQKLQNQLHQMPPKLSKISVNGGKVAAGNNLEMAVIKGGILKENAQNIINLATLL